MPPPRLPPDEQPPLLPLTAARRLLLSSQSLLGRPRPATLAGVYELVHALGFVQIDSINRVARAQHLILGARIAAYRPALLTTLVERERRLFEHWTHDAAVIPTLWFPYWRHRFERFRQGIAGHRWWQERLGPRQAEIIARVRERIREEGPLAARDFEGSGTRGSSWWGWRPEKAALELLWFSGELAVCRRVNFAKVYDLTERVLPAAWAAPLPAEEDHLDWACSTALARLGAATPEEIAAFWKAVPTDAARRWCEEAAASGRAARVLLPGGGTGRPRLAYAVPDWRERAETEVTSGPRLRLLAPFDPVLHDRRRTQRLFGFDYRFEAFVPAGKRKHGYYVLPILEGDQLIGRLDPRLHSASGWLEVKEVWWEPGIGRTARRQEALAAAVARLARLVKAERWSLPAAKTRRGG